MQATNLVTMFLETVEKVGSKEALYQKNDGVYQGFSYNEFAKRIREFALGLAAMGITRGDRVALMSENRPEWPISDVGILSLGAINVPLYPTLTPKQVEYILNDSETKVVIVSQPELLDKVQQISDNVPSLEKIILMDSTQTDAEKTISFQDVYQKGADFEKENPDYYQKAVKKIRTDDLCGIIYTSGTTGAPKGVMLSHGNLLSNVKAGLAVLHIDEREIFLSFLPLCHSFERMAGQYAALAVGATIYYAESVEKVAENLTEVRPTVMTAVPRLFEKIYARIIENANSGSFLKKRIFWWAINTGDKYVKAKKAGNVSGLLQRKYSLATKLVFSKLHQRIGGRLRFFVSGGAPLSKDIAEFFYKAGILILEGYGLTDTSPVITVNHEQKFKFGSVGQAVPGVAVKIADDGEILTKGPHVMKGYYKNPDATAETIDAESWLHTGDIGFLDDKGYLYITDRKKNIIVTSGGKNVTPSSIENLLITSPYIEQVMVIGDKRKFLSALIVPAFDSLKNSATAKQIQYNTIEDLVNHPAIYQMIEEDIERLTADLARFEQIKKFTLLPNEFTIENGEMTPSLKIKRKVIAEKYADIIDKMYEE